MYCQQFKCLFLCENNKICAFPETKYILRTQKTLFVFKSYFTTFVNDIIIVVAGQCGQFSPSLTYITPQRKRNASAFLFLCILQYFRLMFSGLFLCFSFLFGLLFFLSSLCFSLSSLLLFPLSLLCCILRICQIVARIL